MQYRKKPVIVEAFQMTKERCTNKAEWPQWLQTAFQKTFGLEGAVWRMPYACGAYRFVIGTLEGNQHVSLNDWIIRGVKGELYACKPDIFEITYEPVDG